MALSREELQRRLMKLEVDLPTLIAAHPDAGDFNEVFAARVDEITDAAGAEHDGWADEQIDRILVKFELWRPGQDDVAPDG